MVTHAVSMKVVRAVAFLGALFATGAVVGRMLSAPPALLGLGLVALALRIWVMLPGGEGAAAEPPAAGPATAGADVHPLRVANG